MERCISAATAKLRSLMGNLFGQAVDVATPLRPPWGAQRHRRPGVAGLCHLPGPTSGLGRHSHGGLAGHVGRASHGLLGHRSQVRSAVAPHTPVPLEHSSWGQHRRVPPHGELLHLHLRGHPVHAAGARVLGSEDRVRLANGFAHLGDLRRPLADACHQDLGQGRHGSRDVAHRRRDNLGHSNTGPRPVLGAPGWAVLCGRRRHRLRVHTRSR